MEIATTAKKKLTTQVHYLVKNSKKKTKLLTTFLINLINLI